MNERAFHENVTVITGASSGIGRELAYQLAEQGAWLALGARDTERLKETAAGVERRGGRALVVVVDVADPAQCQKLIAQTVKTYGRLETLVNNAGIGMLAKFDSIANPAFMGEMMQVNYMGSVYCTHAALPYLKQAKGRLVGIASLTGKTGVPLRSGYAASKHAMAGFFDSLRIELAETGVTVTMMYPSFVATEVRERAFGADGKPLGKSVARRTDAMPVEECVRLIVRAMAERRREEVMTTRGKLGLWIKLIAPGLVDQIARQTAAERG